MGKYLGANISHPKRRKDKYNTVVERITKKLNGLCASSLSLVGRITHVKSVASSMTLYPMQHDRLPKDVARGIEREQRKFIWGEKGGSKKRYVISWEQISKPREAGGIDIKNLQLLMNDAFLLKHQWEMEVKPSIL